MIFNVIIKMKIIILLFLSIFHYPIFTTQDDSCVKNEVICTIAGRGWLSTYVFNISELPEDCDIFTIGQFSFDLKDNINTNIMESDKSIIGKLVEANKTIYVQVGFMYGLGNWHSIFEPKDPDSFKKEQFDPLINFLNKSKVNGILINCKYIYNVDVVDFPSKLSNFVSEIRNKVDNLIIGLIVSGSYYDNFPKNSIFNFSMTNEVLDFYVVDWSILNECRNDTVKTGLTPVTSKNPDVLTVEQVTSGVTNSSMGQLKVYAMIQVLSIIPNNLLSKDARSITTYSTYCNSADPSNSAQWCTNPSKVSYDQGAYAKKYYVGIVIEQLDTDDYKGFCECEKFPVTNLIIDGWKANAFKICPKLEHK